MPPHVFQRALRVVQLRVAVHHELHVRLHRARLAQARAAQREDRASHLRPAPPHTLEDTTYCALSCDSLVPLVRCSSDIHIACSCCINVKPKVR